MNLQKVMHNDVIYNSCGDLAEHLNHHKSYVSRMIKQGKAFKITQVDI